MDIRDIPGLDHFNLTSAGRLLDELGRIEGAARALDVATRVSREIDAVVTATSEHSLMESRFAFDALVDVPNLSAASQAMKAMEEQTLGIPPSLQLQAFGTLKSYTVSSDLANALEEMRSMRDEIGEQMFGMRSAFDEIKGLDVYTPPDMSNFMPRTDLPTIPELHIPENPIYETNLQLAGLRDDIDQLRNVEADQAAQIKALTEVSVAALRLAEQSAIEAKGSSRQARIGVRVAIATMVLTSILSVAQIVDNHPAGDRDTLPVGGLMEGANTGYLSSAQDPLFLQAAPFLLNLSVTQNEPVAPDARGIPLPKEPLRRHAEVEER